MGLLALKASGKDTGVSEKGKGSGLGLGRGFEAAQAFGCFGLVFSLWSSATLNIRTSMCLARPRIAFHFPVLLFGWSCCAGRGGRNLSRQ